MRTFLLALLGIVFVGCSTVVQKAKPVAVPQEAYAKKVSFLEAKEVLDKRCVVCHSCYNSPCQAKYSSYEGLDRGASKILVYDATRLEAIPPTRLFIDASTTKQWRKKGFFSVTHNDTNTTSQNDSLFLSLIEYKQKHPQITGEYDPEHEEWLCPKDSVELHQYYEKKPYHGMPYGLPQLSQQEFLTLRDYIAQGAKPPTKEERQKLYGVSKSSAMMLQKWEKFFNAKDPKHSVTARYLYEHIYLGHIHFDPKSQEYFELVRSKTPSPQPIEVIPTLRPFDDPKMAFYYRFRKVHSTLVHKTHIVLTMDEGFYKRIQELFIQPKWTEEPHLLDYDPKRSTMVFENFFQIPVKSRYQFLLDNSQFIITTFIRGPVCRGQMAVNVIHDHFWVMFLDPKYDLSVRYPSFLLLQSDNLEMPIESVSQNLLETFSDAYREKYLRYFVAKERLYDKTYPQGLGVEAIWAGENAKDSPFLTVYRHFNSASLHKGALGALPRTAWVMDYPQFERLYYTLVAGYDVFGNISHQTNIRRYMDFLRLEGEINFISFLPPKSRLKILKSWYIGDDEFLKNEYGVLKRDTKVAFQTKRYKKEFLEQVIIKQLNPVCNIKLDKINYYTTHAMGLPTQIKTPQQVDMAFAQLDKRHVGFIQQLNGYGINNALVRIILPDGSSVVKSIVINRWHDNVNSLFLERYRLNPKKDTIDIIDGSVGSYPNMFIIIDAQELPQFLRLVATYKETKEYDEALKHFFISRADPKFWEVYDWFQSWYLKREPIYGGLYDLNRYYKVAF